KSVSVSGDAGHQALLYTLDYSNLGSSASDNVVLTEYVPFLTTFAAPSSDSRWACDPATPYAPLVGGGLCHLSLGSVGAGTNGTVAFEVEEGATAYPVLPDFPIYNLTSIAGDGIDANPDNNAFDLSTPDVGCTGVFDPVQFLLCVAHGASPSG